MKNNVQYTTPIFDSLLKYANDDITPFHVPGHKKGSGVDHDFKNYVGINVLSIDVTVFKSVDSFHNPKSSIKIAEELCAEAFGADKSFLCVHGTSGAIQTMIMSVVGVGDKLVVPRNVHKSVSAGIILSGSIPVYMQPEIDEIVGVALNVTPDTVRSTLLDNPDAKAVLIINPTYYGVAADIEEIAAIVHEYDIPLIVDEAHGPHLCFNSQLPISAMDAGADMCAQSTHKLLGAMTQGSMIHVKKGRVDVNRVKSVLSMMHTTSPSYILLASLDVARMQMATQGNELLDKAINLACIARKEINNIKGLFCFGTEIVGREGAFSFDITKLTINCRGLGITGNKLEEILIDDYNIQVEMSDLYNVLAIVTFGDSFESINNLIQALQDISSEYEEVFFMDNNISLPKIPPALMAPRDAFNAKKVSVELDMSIGEISAEMIMAYPPGIPVIYQGELITEEIIQYIKLLKMSGADVQGTVDANVDYIQVIDSVFSVQSITTA